MLVTDKNKENKVTKFPLVSYSASILISIFFSYTHCPWNQTLAFSNGICQKIAGSFLHNTTKTTSQQHLYRNLYYLVKYIIKVAYLATARLLKQQNNCIWKKFYKTEENIERCKYVSQALHGLITNNIWSTKRFKKFVHDGSTDHRCYDPLCRVWTDSSCKSCFYSFQR